MQVLPGLPGGKGTLRVSAVLYLSHHVGLWRRWVPGTGVDGTSPWQGTCSPRCPSGPEATSRSKPGLGAAFPSLLWSPLPGASILREKQAQLYKPLGRRGSGPRGALARDFWREPKREEALGALAASRAKSGEFRKVPQVFLADKCWEAGGRAARRSGRLRGADFQVRMPTAAPAGARRNSRALLGG